jgi:hypothetical protein
MGCDIVSRTCYDPGMIERLGKYNEPWPDAESGPFRLRATVHLIDGRPEVTRIELGPLNADAPVAIRTVDIRRVALGPIIESVVARKRRQARIVADDPTLPVRQRQPDWAKPPAVQAQAQRYLAVTAPEKRTGRPSLPRAHYEEVARVYLDALNDGESPRLAVSEHFHVSESNAAKWIYRCRRDPLNLLAPTARGRSAGDNNPTDRKKVPPRRVRTGGVAKTPRRSRHAKD